MTHASVLVQFPVKDRVRDTYAAVAENISTGFPRVRSPSTNENKAVNDPIAASRFNMLLIEYNTTIDKTGKLDAIVTISSLEIRSRPAWE